jgi:hypothetical protein
MGWKRTIARATCLGAALLLFGTGAARAKDPRELLQQDLIVTRVERGVFPNVRLWIMPVSAESMATEEGKAPQVYEVVPDFLRGKTGVLASLKHPQNVRNIEAYYLAPGDKVFCSRATYQAKSRRWVLDGIQRIIEKRPPKLVRGSRRLGQDPLQVEVITDRKVYGLGEPIRVTVRATNPSKKPVTLVFPTGETHAMSVYAGFDEVWRLATIEQMTSKPIKVTLQPGQSLAYTEVWDQKMLDGKAAGAGRYFAGGKVISQGRTIFPETRVSFRIKSPEDQQATAETPAASN